MILDPPTDDLRAIVHQNESNGFFTVNLHFMKIFPLPICTAVIGVSLQTRQVYLFYANLSLQLID